MAENMSPNLSMGVAKAKKSMKTEPAVRQLMEAAKKATKKREVK